MGSTLNVSIDLEGEALPAGTDAMTIVEKIAKFLATEYGPAGLPVVQFGRYARQGREDGPNVTVKLQSAALQVKATCDCGKGDWCPQTGRFAKAQVREASELGLAAGVWPLTMSVSEVLYRRADAQRDGGFAYSSDLGQWLVVIND